jgi:hypothetical protein
VKPNRDRSTRHIVIVCALMIGIIWYVGGDPPVLDPIIGLRSEEDGVLKPVLEIDERTPGYIGCDLKWEHVPTGDQVELVWLFKPEQITDPARVIHQAWYRVDPKRPIRAWVDPVPGPNGKARGAYECVWTHGHRGISARLVVRAGG